MKNVNGNRPIRVLQLCLCGGGNFGGVQHFLYEYCSHIDNKVVHFDYLYLNRRPQNAGDFNRLLDNTNVYELNVLNIRNILKKYLLMLTKIKAIIKQKKYDVIHINTGVIHIAMLMVYLAKKDGIPVRIVHSHAVHVPEKKISKIGTKLFRRLMQKSLKENSTHQFACSEKAGSSMFGDTEKLKDYHVIKNAINVDKFKYSPEIRSRIRKDMDVENNKVIITVGNLMEIKNHGFLIDVFQVLLEKDASVRLWIVGGGSLKDTLQMQIDSLQLSEQVMLLGARNDVNELLQAADLYVCPSLSEGFSISIIEAQAAGLRVLASDGVPEEPKVTKLVTSLSLDAGKDKWALEIMRILNEEYSRENKYKEIIDVGYEINTAAKHMEKFYVSSLWRIDKCK